MVNLATMTKPWTSVIKALLIEKLFHVTELKPKDLVPVGTRQSRNRLRSACPVRMHCPASARADVWEAPVPKRMSCCLNACVIFSIRSGLREHSAVPDDCITLRSITFHMTLITQPDLRMTFCLPASFVWFASEIPLKQRRCVRCISLWPSATVIQTTSVFVNQGRTLAQEGWCKKNGDINNISPTHTEQEGSETGLIAFTCWLTDEAVRVRMTR